MLNISKRFDAVQALNNASLTIAPGKITALLGANGSGKSTMVKVLGGLVNSDSGEIKLDDKLISINSASNSRKFGIAVAYQDLSLMPQMTVMENIFLNHEIKTSLGYDDRNKMAKKASEILKRLDIKCNIYDKVDSLASSVQSMVEIAKALSWEPSILLLDEVTASLHHDEVEVLFKVLGELKEQGLAIVMVTHRMNEVYRLADNATILRNGETVANVLMKDVNLDEVIFYMTGKKPEKISCTEDLLTKETETVFEAKNIIVGKEVKNVSMKVCKGEIVGIGGLQDQGQAEFIRAIISAPKATSGEFKLIGKTCKFKSTSEAMKNGIGFISGDRTKESVFSIRSIAENIFAASAPKGGVLSPLNPKSVNDTANNIVEKFKIKIGHILNPASSLSGGNQQKLAIGRWMQVNPTLLLLDDPTKGVDIAARVEIMNIIKEAAMGGMTVIISSSDNEEILSVSDRIYVFYEGKINAVLEGSNRTEERLVASMMGIESEVQGDE